MCDQHRSATVCPRLRPVHTNSLCKSLPFYRVGFTGHAWCSFVAACLFAWENALTVEIFCNVIGFCPPLSLEKASECGGGRPTNWIVKVRLTTHRTKLSDIGRSVRMLSLSLLIYFWWIAITPLLASNWTLEATAAFLSVWSMSDLSILCWLLLWPFAHLTAPSVWSQLFYCSSLRSVRWWLTGSRHCHRGRLRYTSRATSRPLCR